ncbi:hypothetical protein V8D89_007622 [Ganoderma adspersum]
MSRPSPMRSDDDSASSQPITPRTPQGGDETRPVALSCKFDEHMMSSLSLIPTYKPLDEQQLTDFLLMSGATKDTLDEYLQGYNHMTEEKIQTAGVKAIGVRFLSSVPSSYLNVSIERALGQASPSDPNVYSVRIPNSPYVIRMWDGGMDYWGQFCLDFFDVERRVPVNLPAGHGLYGAGETSLPPGVGGDHPLPDHLVRANVRPAESYPIGSWERNMGIARIPDGEEKWSLPEGTRLTLQREGHPPLTFQVPTRQAPVAVIHPQKGVPY